MKTNVIMKRVLFGGDISQRSDNEFFSATDLVKMGNKWRVTNEMEMFSLKNYLQNKSTKEFMVELTEKHEKIKINAGGKNRHTWVHPFLFIDIALAINPKLKIEVYQWLFDHLIKNRNESGDSYKKMCGALYAHSTVKSQFNNGIQELARMIKIECGLKREDKWEVATEKQLKLRDRIHENIALLADVLNNNQEAMRIGILKAKEQFTTVLG
jgi:hypothetical protein